MTVFPTFDGFGDAIDNNFGSRLHNCEETENDICGPRGESEEPCCHIEPCRFCIRWEPYGGDTKYGTMQRVSPGVWTAQLDGMDIELVRDPYQNCRTIWYIDGEEVQSYPHCDDEYETAIDCRNPMGDFPYTRTTSDGDEDGTIYFEREIEHQLNERDAEFEGEGCNGINFCGNCWCACNTLCATVTLTDDNGGELSCTGILNWTGELCEDRAVTASWAGSVTGCINPYDSSSCSFDITAELVKATENDYETPGSCVMVIEAYSECCSVNGRVSVTCPELSASVSSACENITAEVSVSCNRCGECVGDPLPCCPGFPAPSSLNFFLSQDDSCGDCNQPDPVALTLVRITQFPTPIYTYQAVVYIPANDSCEGGGDYYNLIDFECREDATEGAALAIHPYIVPGPGEDPPSIPFDSDDIPPGTQSIFDNQNVDAECEFPIFTFELGLCGGFGASPVGGSTDPANTIGVVTA